MTNLKEALFQQCVAHVNMRLQTIQTIISSHQKALSSETKSSAGDKHETGRAMLQLEMEKAGQQLASVQQMQQTLARVAIAKPSISVRLGTIIETSSIHYFLSVSDAVIQTPFGIWWYESLVWIGKITGMGYELTNIVLYVFIQPLLALTFFVLFVRERKRKHVIPSAFYKK